jgi:hypothetical protein
MDNTTVVYFPNEGAYTINKSLVSKWEIIETKTIGDIIFCKTKDNSSFSINVDEYNKIFK